MRWRGDAKGCFEMFKKMTILAILSACLWGNNTHIRKRKLNHWMGVGDGWPPPPGMVAVGVDVPPLFVVCLGVWVGGGGGIVPVAVGVASAVAACVAVGVSVLLGESVGMDVFAIMAGGVSVGVLVKVGVGAAVGRGESVAITSSRNSRTRMSRMSTSNTNIHRLFMRAFYSHQSGNK